MITETQQRKVIQCASHTRHVEYALPTGSGDMPGEFLEVWPTEIEFGSNFE